MICPFCRREMSTGTLDTPSSFRNIEWYPEAEKSYLGKAGNSITVRSAAKFEFPIANLCFHCHKLIIDVPERSNFKFIEE
ncbi:PF20097 family protein [Candidatus Clostridium stratigraminis]|uniref:PF20097 family protein n=1 Tax=Candidatus Clostridium stratigraminis TaxID=3381661 RepID=A0ABW8T1R9_9CLOT